MVVAAGAVASTCLVAQQAAAHEGWGIVRDAHGRIYVTDIPGNTIWRIGIDGRVEPVLRDVHSHALVVGADGAIYGTNVHLTKPIRGVWRLDMTGRLTTIIPATRGLPLDLQPFLLASDGTIYSVSPHQPALAADQRQLFVLRRSAAGVVDTVAGGLKGHASGRGVVVRFSAIDGMAWLPDSSLLLVDGARLRKMTADGVVTSLTEPLTSLRWDQDLMGTSAAADGSMYVADFAGRRIHTVDGAGHRVLRTGGWYWAPTGVLASVGGFYVLEHPRAPFGILGDLGLGAYLRVRLIREDGSTLLIARVWGRNTKALGAVIGGVVALIVGITAWRRR